MYSHVRSLGLNGIDGLEVSVECNISNGLPAFDVVGLPDAAVKESRDRVRAAVKNCGFTFPVSRITLNLAPANVKKTGSLYDLPILMSILGASHALKLPGDDTAYLGELSLEGQLRAVPGVLPMAMAAKALGIRTLFVPEENAAEATLAGDLTVYAVHDVRQLVAHLREETPLTPQEKWIPESNAANLFDFKDVKGQENVKRALEIAAAGGHNVLMVGPPGSGKSMLAKRLPSILPDMTREESLDATKIHSVAGLLSNRHPLVRIRPFRAPHHTISAPGLAGGGTNPRPGEISLAHNGVLFLDELPEFKREALEVLRQPLEDGTVTISRVSSTVTYPNNFMLVCAMNPCKCGWYGDPSGRCTCSQQAVAQYLSRVSGPLLDRIDIVVEVPAVPYEQLKSRRDAEPSEAIKARVDAARDIQRKRFAQDGIFSNSEMMTQQLKKYCVPDEDADKLLHQAFDALGMTARSYDRILRVARTIADLDGAEDITSNHIAEAIQYRSYQIGDKSL